MIRRTLDNLPAYHPPTGFSFRTFRPGDETEWAELHTAAGLFASVESARARFASDFGDHLDELETRIAATEQAIRDLEQAMAAPGFYEDRAAAQPVIDRHQALMWEVGDLMHRWEELQSSNDLAAAADA